MNAKERAAMGELRSLLQIAPETSSQRRVFIKKLAALLDRFRAQLLSDVIIDYVLQAMSVAPLDSINLAPTDRWLNDFVRGRDVPQLALVTTIDLGPRSQSAPLLAKVLHAEGFKRLNHIRLRGWRLDADFISCLNAAPAAGVELRRLELEECICSPEWAEALVQWAGLEHVQELLVPSQALTSANASALALRPALKFRALSFYGQGCTAQALTKLLDAPWVESLRTLEIDALNVRYSERPDHEHVHAIVQCERLTALEKLGLRSFSLSPSSARALSCSSALDGLLSLDLSSCSTLGDLGLEALLENPSMSSLIELNLSDCGIGEGVRDLLDLDLMPSLRKLDLSYNVLVYERDLLNYPYHMYGPIPPEHVRRYLFEGREGLELIYKQRG